MIKYNLQIRSQSSTTPMLRIFRATTAHDRRPFIEHSHTAFEIAYFLSGHGIYTVKDTNYDFMGGDIFVFSSNEQHYVTEVTDDNCEYITIHFDPKYLWDSNSIGLSEENSNFCFTHSATFKNRLPRGNIYTEKIKNLIISAADEILEKRPEYKLMIKSFINEITVTLIRNLGYIGEDTEDTIPTHAKAIKNVISFIDKNLGQPLVLKDLSSIAKMSPNYFCAVFKHTNNITVFEYIISKRCDMAAQLLITNPELNVIEVAEKCGFNNSANFNKAFKKKIGVTPSEYRKINRNN